MTDRAELQYAPAPDRERIHMATIEWTCGCVFVGYAPQWEYEEIACCGNHSGEDH